MKSKTNNSGGETFLCHPCTRLWKGENPRFKKKDDYKGPTIKRSTIHRELDHMARCYEKKRQDRLRKAPSDIMKCGMQKTSKPPNVEDMYNEFLNRLQQDIMLRKRVALHSQCSKLMLMKSKSLDSQFSMSNCECYYCWRPQSETSYASGKRQLSHTESLKKIENQLRQSSQRWLVKKCHSQDDKKSYKKYLVHECSDSESSERASSCQDSELSENDDSDKRKKQLLKRSKSSQDSDLSLESDKKCDSQKEKKLQKKPGQFVIQWLGENPKNNSDRCHTRNSWNDYANIKNKYNPKCTEPEYSSEIMCRLPKKDKTFLINRDCGTPRNHQDNHVYTFEHGSPYYGKPNNANEDTHPFQTKQ